MPPYIQQRLHDLVKLHNFGLPLQKVKSVQ